MSNCDKCAGDNYILLGCCSGRECGCMGHAVQSTNCPECNPLGDKEPGIDIAPEMEYLEYVGVCHDAS